MKTVIPASFQIAGHTVAVRIVPPSRWKHGADCEGVWWPSKKRIEILSTLKGSHREQRFYHELVHCVLDTAGHEALSKDEGLVDRLAALLHQSLVTMR